MNNQGFSNNNLHIGDTYIKNGDLNVDGNLIVDSLSIDGYTLPTSAGTNGQVITMNPDNTTTSFKDVSIPTLIDQRIATSRWFTQQQSLLDFSAYTGIFLNSNTGDSTTIGDSVLPATDLTLSEENYSVLHVQFILRINTTDIAQPNQWQCRLRLDDGVGQGTIEWETQEFTGTLQTDSERIQDFYLTFIRNPADPTKINVSNQSIKHTNAISSTAPTSTNTDKLFLSNNQFKLGSETGEISMLLPTTKSYFCQFNNYADGRPLTITMACQRPNSNVANTIDYGVLVGELYTFKKQTLPSGGPVINDHTTLSNLTTGDAGHTQFALLSGRLGGQVLSGGLLPIHNLVLKSHDIGLPNLTVKDLNTEFNKNIDMNNNDIINSNFVYASTVQTDTIENSGSGFLTFTNLGGGITPSFTPSGLDLNLGGINSVSSINNITPVGGLFSGTSDSLNVAATTAEISIMPFTFVGTVLVAPNGFSIGDTFELNLSGPFNSNNSDTLTIRLKGGPTATTLLATLVVPLNASSGSVFQLCVLFQIRAIGGPGVADIIIDADLTYNQSGGGGSFVGEQSFSQNNTTFATDVANVLDVTAQFSSASVNNDMTTRFSKLNKVF